MKKELIMFSLTASCLLSSCAQTPGNIEGANHKVDFNSANKVTV